MSNMYIEVSDTCMYHCVTCPKGKHAYLAKSDYITAAEVIDKIRSAQQHTRIDSVTLSGGEPLLNPNIFDILAKISALSLPITLLSNLYLVVPNHMAAKLRAAAPRLTVVAALHSSKAEEHDRITGLPGSFAHTTAAISALLEQGISVTVKVILDDETCRSMMDIFQFVQLHWGKHVRLNLCGLDLCGLTDDERRKVLLHYPTQAAQLETFLSAAEHYYGDTLQDHVVISEYPLCCVDPYFWKLVHKTQTNLTAYIRDNTLLTSEHLRKESTCFPHAEKCRSCLAEAFCPGIWYSVYALYGEELVTPYQQA